MLPKSLFADFSGIMKILPSSMRRMAFWAFFCIAIQALLEVTSIIAISFLAMSIAAPEQMFSRPQAQVILQMLPSLRQLEANPRDMALVAAGTVTALIALKNLMFAYVSFFGVKFGERISLYVGSVLFRHYLYSSYDQHLSGDSTDMFQGLSWRNSLASMTTDLMEVYTYFTITIALSILVIVSTPGIILLITFFMGFTAWLLYRFLKKRMRDAGEKASEWASKTNKVTLNAMRGIRETLIYQQQPVFFEKFLNACQGGIKDRAFLGIAPPLPTWILETAGFLVIFITVLLMIKIEHSSMAQITAVVTIIMLASWRILPLLNRSLRALIVIQGIRHPAMECLARVQQALADPAAEPEAPDPDFTFEHSIELRSADFCYGAHGKNDLKTVPASMPEEHAEQPAPQNAEDEKRHVLRGISMVLPKGKRIGIIGRSGAGKSTLTLLLSGLIPPSAGEMLVDGKPLKGGRLAAYRRLVGFVPQNPYIMGGSIAENVAFCQWGKPWDEEKVLSACAMAEFDVAFDRGIDSGLGQDGAGLSGGQAQRLSIARALYAEPAILIFDEATSALDTGVEKAIMQTILALPREITTITIAHRLDTLKGCDIVYWLEMGSIREYGPPEEILPRYEIFLEERTKTLHPVENCEDNKEQRR